mmetsp:Transcript_34315/g.80273  ORF Transcript_34315/g.80273 Transcript_34315/m.80273 type:complete len:873 (-) Transcript_34315:35-2653(-)
MRTPPPFPSGGGGTPGGATPFRREITVRSSSGQSWQDEGPPLRVASPQVPCDGAVTPPPAAGQEAPASSSSITVAVRCRPLSGNERAAGAQDICRVLDRQLVILLDPSLHGNHDFLRIDKSREKRYAFDHAFGAEVNTEEVFTACTAPLIASVMQAYKATVFAYGATGAGKTFTMIGTPQVPGIMVRAVEELFRRTSAQRALNGRSGRTSVTRCSFIEVYNENLRDLLVPDGREGYLDLREDPERGMCVSGVSEMEPQSAEEVMDLLRQGNQNRTTEPTAMNETSSRSHAVLQITVEQRDYGADEVLLGKLSLIDLAGSERASQTDNRGVRLLEGANINRSLLALGNCINALASGSSFVPYRDSKLTRLLKDSLGGNCKTVMVANISPNSISYEDTLNTLKYANRAKNIKLTPHQIVMRPSMQINQYKHIIEDLRSEVAELKTKLVERGGVASGPPANLRAGGDEYRDVTSPADQEASERWKEEVLRNLEGRSQLMLSLIEVDRGLNQWYAERDDAKAAIANLATGARLGVHRSGTGLEPLARWEEQLRQIEESIRENLETKASIEKRLQASKAVGRELHAQLPQRVLNEDLRTFLELIQKVQELEVERLELDYGRELRLAQLKDRDAEIAALRAQLRLRDQHLFAQREMLSDEQQQHLPAEPGLLGNTLSRTRPQGGLLRAFHAWVPQDASYSKDVGGGFPLDAADASVSATQEQGELPRPGREWRGVELPQASQIRGIAQLQQAAGGNPASRTRGIRPGGKGWQEPPALRQPSLNAAGVAQTRRQAAPGSSAAVRGVSWPTRKRISVHDDGLGTGPGPSPSGPANQVRASPGGIGGVPYERERPKRRVRARSEQPSAMGRAGRIAVQSRR